MDMKNFTLFDHLASDVVIEDLHAVRTGMDKKGAYYRIIRSLLDTKQSLYEYIVTKMLSGDSKKLTVYEKNEVLDVFQKACLHHDLEIFKSIFQSSLEEICKSVGDEGQLLIKLEESRQKDLDGWIKAYIKFFEALNEKDKDESVDQFAELLRETGLSPFALYPAFKVKEIICEETGETRIRLDGFESIHSIGWEQIYYYQHQKEQLIKNTKDFVEGRSFQNVLLVGASGTGKSTSVKAVVNLFTDQKLRLIQMQKGQLHLLPQLLKYIEGRRFKYILFIDDLSFEANEDEYKFLKSFIEGSVSGDMSHVAFYVTSNRRHLIKEVRTERENDIHLNDFIQEMTSLSDRFGLTLLYESLNQKEYFDMVLRMVNEKGDLDKSDIEITGEARIFAMRHGKMSGRVAMQFIKHLGL